MPITVMEYRRRTKGLTQIELAQHVGLSQPEISLIESGHAQPKPDVRAALARTLDVDPLHLQLDYAEWLRVLRDETA